jgi:hypothetical protein
VRESPHFAACFLFVPAAAAAAPPRAAGHFDEMRAQRCCPHHNLTAPPVENVSKVPKASPKLRRHWVRIGASVESPAKLQISCARIGGESGRNARHCVGDVVVPAKRGFVAQG